jgi:hypothetical protein
MGLAELQSVVVSLSVSSVMSLPKSVGEPDIAVAPRPQVAP